MTVQEAIDYLKSKGYKYETSIEDGLFITHYLYKRTKGEDCKRNHKPPNLEFGISEYKKHTSMIVGITGENTAKRWCNFRLYALDLEEVKNHEECMYTFTTMWNSIN